jgi:ATP-binding cassette subfamily F protein 3
VVISHDRHLLRSVCDELLIVHDGIVDRFTRSLDEYPAWLKEQEARENQNADEKDKEKPTKKLTRKQLRQQEAQRRQRLKPLYDKVRYIEDQLASNKDELATVQERLADEAIYSDTERKSELAELIKEQASLKSATETLEWNWMEASEALERAD